MLPKLLSIVALLAVSAVCLARPADWYWWVSRMDDGRICAQTTPGKGWYREPQAFTDSHCNIRVR